MNARRPVLPLLLPAMLALLVALWAGLVRMGWPWPLARPDWPAAHGALMIPAFFGGLISLERAVALRRRWTFLAPLLHGLGGLVLILNGNALWTIGLLLAGGAVFLAMFIVIVKQHPATYTVLMAVGVGTLVVGDLLWGLGWPVFRVVYWWMVFLVLTIAAERLELGRLRRLPRAATQAFMLAVGVTLAGLLALFGLPALAARLVGLGFTALALWLLRYDVARKTVRMTGLPRFAAVCLLSGYLWLGIGGVWMIAAGPVAAGFSYDGMLHTVLIGFVFSMIFGHAPIIFPALFGWTATFHPRLYLPLIGLHASLALRLLGDLLQHAALRRWGGLLNATFILIFLGMMALTVRTTRASAER